MKYGICNLSIVPMRGEASDKSELVSQVLYGELFKVLEHRARWSRIRLQYDSYEGWIDNKQFVFIDEDIYLKTEKGTRKLASDMVNFVATPDHQLLSICIGSELNNISYLNHTYEGGFISGISQKNNLLNTAILYLNAPYLWGGKSPFGIDCSGFTQMVYKLNGHFLLRDASMQATQGEPLSFIEESEPGDLAFFDNKEGDITHVGIIMKDHYIIHAHGKVRIDRLDHTGIFNSETRKYSHQLRVIKRII